MKSHLYKGSPNVVQGVCCRHAVATEKGAYISHNIREQKAAVAVAVVRQHQTTRVQVQKTLSDKQWTTAGVDQQQANPTVWQDVLHSHKQMMD